jgi:phosphate-selective porin
MSRTRMIVVAVVTAGLAAAVFWTPAAVQHEDAQASAQNAQTAQAAPKKKTSPHKEFMRDKLAASNQVLEGLLTEDYKLIEKGGRKFREMSDAAKWRVSTDMMYRSHSEDFQRNVDKLIETAEKAESIDRVALAWFDTTLSCIDCHRWVRTVLIADSKAPLGLPIAAASESGE